MNGGQDLGGMMGFGPVKPERDEPVFHADWEGRVLAMSVAMGPVGGWTGDRSRFARENRPAHEYLSMSYYQLWYAGLCDLLVDFKLATQEEISSGTMSEAPKKLTRIISAEDVAPMLAKGSPAIRDVDNQARYSPGDRVRAKNVHPTGHTRLPRYVRGRSGVVTHVQGAHKFPDASALGDTSAADWLYTVRFSGEELWGESADPTITVSVDAWESYLEPAE